MGWQLDEDRVAVGEAGTNPNIAGRIVPGETYNAAAFGLTDAEMADAEARLGVPMKQVAGAGVSEQPVDPDKAPSVDQPSGEPAAAPQPDGEVTRQALAFSADLESRGGSLDATDAAQTLAADLHVDLATVEGSGAGGRITKDDVQAAAPAQPPPGDEG